MQRRAGLSPQTGSAVLTDEGAFFIRGTGISGRLRKLAPSQVSGDSRPPGRTESASWPDAPTTPHRSACSARRRSAGSTWRWRLTSRRTEDSAGCAATIQNPWSLRPYGPAMHKLGRVATSHGPRRKARKHAGDWPGNRNVSDRDNVADIFGHSTAARNCRSAKKCRGAAWFHSSRR
jgi:hypothetical protein